MQQKHVLLITRYFPPLDSIATARMYAWAKYLHKYGHRVSVLTTSKKQQVVHALQLSTSDFDVTELDYFDPICFLGFDKKNEMHLEQGVSVGLKSQTKKLLKRFYQERMNERLPGRTDFWIRPAIKKLKEQKEQGISYDSIISSYGPPSAHIVGYFAKKIFTSTWIADYRDLWLENHVYKGIWPFTWLEKKIEKRLLSYSDIITTVSQSLQEVLQTKFSSIPVHVIENGFDPEVMNKATNNYFASQPKCFRLVYTGSIYAKKRDPSPLFSVLRQLLDESKITTEELNVLFYGSCMGDLQDLITKYNVSSIVKYRGSVSQIESYRIQKSANALLFLEDPYPEINGILTGKLFEYLFADVPILAVGINSETAPGRLINDTHSGLVCGTDEILIKKSLLNLINNNVSLVRNRDLIMQYTREKQVLRLIDLMSHHCLKTGCAI